MKLSLSLREKVHLMSFNQIVKNNKSLNLKFLKDNLLENKDLYLSSYSLKEQTLKGFELKDLDKYEELLEDRVKEVSKLEEVNLSDFNNIEAYMLFLYKKTNSYREELTKNLSDRINHIETKKVELKSKVSEVLQKLNHLGGFSEGYKFVFKEDFYNLFNISKALVEKSLMEINLEANVATLPVKSRVLNEVKNIIISSDSKGIPGNFKTGKNKRVYSLIDKNPDTAFEFFKLNTGPAKLVLNMRFEKTCIINQVKIKRAFSSGSNTLRIEDVLFTQNKSRSIKRFIDVNQQAMEIRPSNNGELIITHLPVQCNSVTLMLSSDEYTETKEGLKVFNIALEKVEFHTLEYEEEGEFNSTRIVTPENLFLLNAETKMFPNNSISYEETISVSTNNGGERKLLPFYGNKTKDLLVPQKQNFLNFIYNLKRNNELTSSSEEISNESYFINSTSLLKTVNKKISPINYIINDESCNETLQVVQSSIFNRSEKREKAIKLGRVKLEGINKIKIPFSLRSYKIDEDDIIIYGNNFELTQVEDEESITSENEYFINYEENSIILKLNSNKTIAIEMLLKPFEGKIIYKNEGYYIEINEPFEYDKKLLKVSTKVSDDNIYEVIIPSKTKRFFLPDENIKTLKIEREGEASWEEVPEEDYFIKSYKAGIIKLNNNNEQLRAKYTKESIKTLSENSFEIWGNKNSVKGIFLYPEDVSFNDHEETIFIGSKRHTLNGVSNVIEGTIKLSPGPVERAYKEVAFIDGYTEFLNVKKMKKDFVPKIEWSESNEIYFTSDKLPYEEGSYTNSIKVYNKTGEEVDRSLLSQDETNPLIFELKKPASDEKSYADGYYLEYYYLNEVQDNTYKFSVNYKDGIIYFSNETEVDNVTVSCKYGVIKIEYSLYHQIKNFSFDKKTGVVSVETEEFGNGNNRVRFLWHEVEDKTSLKGLEKFYSPILYSLKIGMN